MMKKFSLLVCLFFCFLLTACDPNGTLTYSVTFEDYDGTVIFTQTVKRNQAATAPDEPTREGYTFIGWDQEFTKVKEDLVVKALYEINQYTVTFLGVDDEVLKTETVSYMASATAPEVQVPTGYRFVEWDQAFEEVTADLTVKAVFQKLTFTVQFIDYDGTILKEATVEYGDSITAPSDPDRDGYRFSGWDQSFDNITTDLVIKAVYQQLAFTVEFRDFDGTVLKAEELSLGQSATAPEVIIREGYTFVGWDKDFSNVTSDLVVTALYEQNTFTVIFKDFDETIIEERIVNYGEDVTPPSGEMNRLGYEFIGWDQPLTNVRADMVVKAEYQIIEYTISYVSNLYEIKETTWANKQAFVNEFYQDFFTWINASYTKVVGLTKNSSTFTFTKSEVTVTFSNVPGILALDIFDFEKTLATIIYQPFNRVNNQPIIPEENDNYFLNTEPYLTKYRDLDRYFLNCILTTSNYSAYDKGYNQTSNGRVQIFFRFHQWAKGTSITAFNTLPKKYEVTFNDTVTLPTEPTSYTVNDQFSLPVATCETATFIGWFTNPLGIGEPMTEIELGTYGDMTLYAKWDTDLTKHEVVFLNWDYDVIDTKYITPGETVTPPNVNAPNGYRFVGWDKDLSSITSDIVVVAKLELMEYTITYHDTLGGIIELPTEPIRYTIHDAFTIPDIALNGYLFLGWYDNPDYLGNVITKTTYGDLDLYPRFIQIPEPHEEIGDGTIEIVASDDIVQVNRSSRLYAKYDGTYLNSQTLTYISTNPKVATVDETGFVKALATGEVVFIIISELGYQAFTITVVDEPYQVDWVGHQGSGGPVVQNTVSAFLEGARRGYYAMECDVRVSADGIYYICHDDTFTDTLFVDSSLWGKLQASYTWAQLKTFQVKDTYNYQTYYGYLATVAEYLQICKDNGIKAVLELKWTTGINSNDQSKLPGLVELVKSYGMYENAIFLSSMKNCLTFLKTNYPDINVQFLSGSSTTTIENVNWCIENQFSIDMPHNLVTKQFVDLMHNAYLYVNAYTVNYVSDANRLQGLLVDQITTDNLGV